MVSIFGTHVTQISIDTMQYKHLILMILFSMQTFSNSWRMKSDIRLGLAAFVNINVGEINSYVSLIKVKNCKIYTI